MTGTKLVDALVIGGGPAGAAAAIGLARAGASVALVERRPRPGFKPGEIIEPTIRSALAGLGIEEDFSALRSPSLAGSVSVWDDDEPVESHGIINPLGHGVLLDRISFETWLLDAARETGADVRQGIAGLRVSRQRHRWLVEGSFLSIEAGLIVEATGRAGGLVAPNARRHTDRLICLLAYPQAPTGFNDRRLHVEAVDEGWWYAALLPDRRLVVALVTDLATMPRHSADARATWFWDRLARTRLIGERVGNVAVARSGPVRGYPAGSGIREQIDGPSWVAIGEAATTYDPLSGRGVPMALLKGAALARLIVEGASRPGALHRYAAMERETFADYLDEQRKTYRRAAHSRKSAFWSYWQGS